jgi:exosome complex exonuclease DIS3/RRP44
MLGKSKTFMKRTKRGNVVKVVKEHYLRDDISSGVGTVLEKSALCYIIPDTNVVLHQITLLESPIITNAIILQTVLDEVKNQNISVYNRLRLLIKQETKHFYVFANEHHKDTFVERLEKESVNDRNDRAIRVAAAWYMRQLSESVPIFLLTNDKENLNKALKEEISAKSIHQYVRELTEHPELLDLLNYTDDLPTDAGAETGKMGKRKQLFEAHLPMSEVQKGIKNGKYYQGAIRVSRNNVSEAKIEVSGLEGGHTHILIHGYFNINRAVNGDIVAVQLLPKEQWTAASRQVVDRDKALENAQNQDNSSIQNHTDNAPPCGKVIGIIKRNWRIYCGSIDEDANISSTGVNKVLFVPVSNNIPKVRISTRQAKELLTKRITVAIDGWDANSMYPDGHYVGTLGEIYDNDTESEVILLEHDIPHYQFSDAVLKCLPPSDWKILEEDFKNRRDLRGLNIMSVDPPGCTDIDDALHARELPDGNYELGVHIADVTHFVKDGSAIDKEAAKRGTTVYLVDRRIEMLPKLLTNNLCSLRENEERLAFSVTWKMDSDGKILDVEFFKSVIKSRAALTYEEAQTIIDDKTRNDEKAQSLRLLLRFARILKRKRLAAGALTLASPAVKFGLNTETMNPTDVELYQLRETNSMVEEFMLLANIAVATEIVRKFPAFACLRRHPNPNPQKFQSLLKSLTNVGANLDLTSSKALNDSLDNLHAKTPTGDYFNTLVRIMVTRCMEQAVYFISGDLDKEQYRHYGLAAPIYTHFTSPIRRYADIIVHRLLGCAIGVYSLPESIMDKDAMRVVMDEINKRNRMAQYAERASVELYTNVYFNDKNVIESAYVTKVRENAIQVFIPRYGFEHVCYLTEDNKPNLWTFNEEKETLTYGTTVLSMFEELKVRIFVHTSKNYRRKLIVQLVDPPVPIPYTIKANVPETIAESQNGKKRKIIEDEDSASNVQRSTKKKKNNK